MSKDYRLAVIAGGDITAAKAALKQLDSAAASTASHVDKQMKSAAGSLRQVDQAAQVASGGLGSLAASAGIAGLVTLAVGAAKAALDLGNLGQTVLKQQAYFEVWAGGADKAARALTDMDAAVGGSLAQSEKMAAVSKLMGMGLAETSEKAAYLSKMAVLLGGETRSAGDAISEFSAMLANQSIERLDTFGISSGKVRERIAALKAETKGMTTEAAFMTAVMETGAQKMALLEAAGVRSTTAAGDLTTAWKNLREEVAKGLAQPTANIETAIAKGLNDVRSQMQTGSGDPNTQLTGYLAQLTIVKQRLDAINSSPLKFMQGPMAEKAKQEIVVLEARIAALKRVTAEWGDAGVAAATRTGTAIKATEVVVDEAAAKMHKYFLEVAQSSRGPVSGPGYVPSSADQASASVFAQNALIDAWLESDKVARKTIDEQGKAYESRMREASSKISGYVQNAISASKGLFDVGGNKDPFAPGANGPFENVFRTLDIAKNGAASPWASKMNMDQETAKRLSGQFQQGMLTPEVISKLINVDALKQQAQMQSQAEALTQAFSDSVAKAAGVDSKVVKSMLTSDPKQMATAVNGLATDVAKQLGTQGKTLETAGGNLILSMAKGAEGAKGQAVRSVTDITKAMIEAMQATLAGKAASAAASAVVASKTATPSGAPSGGTASRSAYIAGDTIQIVADSQATAALAAAMIADKKRSRLDSFMGAM